MSQDDFEYDENWEVTLDDLDQIEDNEQKPNSLLEPVIQRMEDRVDDKEFGDFLRQSPYLLLPIALGFTVTCYAFLLGLLTFAITHPVMSPVIGLFTFSASHLVEIFAILLLLLALWALVAYYVENVQ